MPNSIWTGSLSFGLVVIPVRLFPAVRKKVVRFHELDRSGRRIRHVRVTEPEPVIDFGTFAPPPRLNDAPPAPQAPERWTPPPPEPPAEEIPYEEVRKGYEIAPGQYVSLTREEVQALAPERSRSIDVEQFVETSAVDPIYFESRYYVAPDRVSATPFQLLQRAMQETDRMALAWITLRQRRYLSAIRAYGDVMLLTTMVHADEVLEADFWMPEAEAPPSDKELKMARMLIDALAGPFEPERFTDEHRERVLRAIQERKPLEAAEEAAPSPTRVMDLMAALEASVKAAKAARAKEERATPAPRKRKRA